MKLSLALFAVLGLLPMAQAQTPPHTPPTPAAMAQHEVQRYTTLLSLTPAQVEQATTFFTTEATARRTHEPVNIPLTRPWKPPSRPTTPRPFSRRPPPWVK